MHSLISALTSAPDGGRGRRDEAEAARGGAVVGGVDGGVGDRARVAGGCGSDSDVLCEIASGRASWEGVARVRLALRRGDHFYARPVALVGDEERQKLVEIFILIASMTKYRRR